MNCAHRISYCPSCGFSVPKMRPELLPDGGVFWSCRCFCGALLAAEKINGVWVTEVYDWQGRFRYRVRELA